MTKDRLDLLDICISAVNLKYKSYNSPEQLQDLLDIEFPRLSFTIDEIVEFNSLSMDIEDNLLILKNTGNG